MTIRYTVNQALTAEQFIDVLKRSTLAERRPVSDLQTMAAMVANSNCLVAAWDDDQLVGVARSMTDFCYACYLSDLAVDQRYQGRGIGRTLIVKTRELLGPHCKLILIAAPAAQSFYQRLGFSANDRCWVLSADQTLA